MNMIERKFSCKSFIIFDKLNNKTLLKIDNRFPQHFYPNSIIDYANIIKEVVSGKTKNYPIVSLTVKDYPFCDFRCQDCLVKESREWARKNIDNLVLDIDKYKKILKDIFTYSKENGVENVRIEFCGEGNPDLYVHRKEIIQYASQKCNMKIIYVSTGSGLTDNDLKEIVLNASFIRISFPGIDHITYNLFSNQKHVKYTYEDSLNTLRKIVSLRKQYNRECDLLIGVRACIRPEFSKLYENFIYELDEIGIDCVQLAKVFKYNDNNPTKINTKLKNVLKKISNSKYKHLKRVQVPNRYNSSSDDRKLKNNIFNICFSALFNPVLYGDHLIVCTQTDKIIDKQFHYGKLNGEINEVSQLYNNEVSNKIRKQLPLCCNDCCSVYDNVLLNKIYDILYENKDNIDNIKFIMEE